MAVQNFVTFICFLLLRYYALIESMGKVALLITQLKLPIGMWYKGVTQR